MYKFTLRIFLFLCILGIISANSFAQTNTIVLGGTYKQNFDNIGDNANAALPSGWRADVSSGTNTVGTFSAAGTTTDRRAGASMNAANNSGIYNFGAGTTSQGNGDRAVGGVTGSTSDKSINIYFDLKNNAAPAITDLIVSYSIEKYRSGSNADGYSVKLYYSTTGLAGSWIAAPTFTSNFPADLNENGFNPAPDASQTRYINGSLSGLSIAQNGHIYLAWNISVTGVSVSNLAQALAIDDVKITAGSAAPPVYIPAYYRTAPVVVATTGDWSANTTWQASVDNGVTDPWATPPHAPDYRDYTITIRNLYTVAVSTAVETDQTIINNGGAIAIQAAGTLSVKDGDGFDITVDGTLTNTAGGKLIIKSENTNQSDVGTASVGPVTGTITGRATVERYISAKYSSTQSTTTGKSAWRLLTAPLKTNIGVDNSIYTNWQAAGSVAAGTGTTVSGPGVDFAARGLDYQSSAPSMKSWNSTTQAFVPVTNTFTDPLFSTSNIGYAAFIRGDRSITTVGAANQTTLSATGNLQTGPVSFNTATANNAYTLVGNPYASAVDLLTFNTDNSGSNIKPTYYYWDPYLTGVYGVGGYVTVSIDNLNNVVIAPDGSGGGNVNDETRFLQSGQAMFVQTRSAGAGGASSVVFNENQKSYNTVNNVLRVQGGSQVDKLGVNLKVISSGSAVLLDGIVAAFNSNYSASIDDYDAAKFYNMGESISFMRNGTALSVERRPGISSSDVFNLNLTNLVPNVSYQLEINPSLSASGLTAFLVDNYLKTTTSIDLGKTTTVDFTINGDAASTGANRFIISFAKPAMIVSGNPAMAIYPNPVTNGVINLQMNNMAAGIYNVRVFNGMGQVVLTRQINHAAGSSTEAIQLGKGASKGVYQLEVVKPDNSKFSTKVIAN